MKQHKAKKLRELRDFLEKKRLKKDKQLPKQKRI
jgi:hypothetical protein